jgi:osmotically-inducible protein OsmY
MESFLAAGRGAPSERMSERGPRSNLWVCLAAALALSGCAPTVTSLAVDGAYTASEERTMDDVIDDNGIKLEINKLLLDERLGAEDKVRAGEIARIPEKVSGVTNDIQVTDEGGVGALVDDFYIEKVIQADYLFDSEIDSSNFRVRSVNGVVYLMGLAESQAELDKAVAIVDARDDVRRIVNYVKVEHSG